MFEQLETRTLRSVDFSGETLLITGSAAADTIEVIEVNGDDAHPLFEWLKSEKGGLLGGKIKWNFTKFLVGRDGTVLKRYGSTTTPDAIAKDIEDALAA